MHTFARHLMVVALTLVAVESHAGIIEVLDLNIIDDAGNASDGLRFLDMTYSDGLTQAVALSNAQATYSNARLATPTEWDDLFSAAGISYSGAATAGDAFSIGASGSVSSTSTGTYDGGALRLNLGVTSGTTTYIWSDPDKSTLVTSTRDYLSLSLSDASITQSAAIPPNGSLGWLLVSDADVVVVPEPSSFALATMCGVGVAFRAFRRKKRKQA